MGKSVYIYLKIVICVSNSARGTHNFLPAYAKITEEGYFYYF